MKKEITSKEARIQAYMSAILMNPEFIKVVGYIYGSTHMFHIAKAIESLETELVEKLPGSLEPKST